ncbi:alpha/beta fold hydrolase [Actinocatenispora comari]|nr:alpha/beta hydrolase [Actinocatenispora comari]
MTGPNGTLPIVFVHGSRLSGTMWDPVRARCPSCRSSAPDLPGHGARRGEAFSLDGAVATVADAIRQLGGRALVVGMSLGGYVGIAAAGRHPDLVAGLVTIGAAAVPRGPLYTAYRWAFSTAGRFPRAVDRLSGWGFRRSLPPAVAAAMTAGGIDSAALPAIATQLAGLDPVGCLRAYPGPVWLAAGSRDPLGRDLDALRAVCRRGTVVRWPGRGHLDCLSDPDRIAALVATAAETATAATATPAETSTAAETAAETETETETAGLSDAAAEIADAAETATGAGTAGTGTGAEPLPPTPSSVP